MVSSRGTTLNRYSPFPSSLPHCLLGHTSTADAAGRPQLPSHLAHHILSHPTLPILSHSMP